MITIYLNFFHTIKTVRNNIQFDTFDERFYLSIFPWKRLTFSKSNQYMYVRSIYLIAIFGRMRNFIENGKSYKF